MYNITVFSTVKTNFVDKGDCKKSSKLKVGHKPLYREIRLTFNIDRRRIDLKFKKMLEAQLSMRPKKDTVATVIVEGETLKSPLRLVDLSTRSLKELSNNITNCLLFEINQLSKKSFDKINNLAVLPNNN